MLSIFKKFVVYVLCISHFFTSGAVYAQQISIDLLSYEGENQAKPFYNLSRVGAAHTLFLDTSTPYSESITFYDSDSHQEIGTLTQTERGFNLEWGKTPLYIDIAEVSSTTAKEIFINAQAEVTFLGSLFYHTTTMKAPSIRFIRDVIAQQSLTLDVTSAQEREALRLKNITVGGNFEVTSTYFHNHHILQAAQVVMHTEEAQNEGHILGEEINLEGNWQNKNLIRGDHIFLKGNHFTGIIGSKIESFLDFTATVNRYENDGIVRAFFHSIVQEGQSHIYFGQNYVHQGYYIDMRGNEAFFKKGSQIYVQGGSNCHFRTKALFDGDIIFHSAPNSFVMDVSDMGSEEKAFYEEEFRMRQQKESQNIKKGLKLITGYLRYGGRTTLESGRIFLHGNDVDLEGNFETPAGSKATLFVTADNIIREKSSQPLPNLVLIAPTKLMIANVSLETLETGGGMLTIFPTAHLLIRQFWKSHDKEISGSSSIHIGHVFFKGEASAGFSELSAYALNSNARDLYVRNLTINKRVTFEGGKAFIGQIEAPEAVVKSLSQKIHILSGQGNDLNIQAEKEAYISDMVAKTIEIRAKEGEATLNNATYEKARVEGATATVSGVMRGETLSVVSTAGNLVNSAQTEGHVTLESAPTQNVLDFGSHAGDVKISSNTDAFIFSRGSPRTVKLVVQKLFQLQRHLTNPDFRPQEELFLEQLGDRTLWLAGQVDIGPKRAFVRTKGPLEMTGATIEQKTGNNLHMEASIIDMRGTQLENGTFFGCAQSIQATYAKAEVEHINLHIGGDANLDFARWEAVRQDLDIGGHLSATGTALLAKVQEGSDMTPWLKVFARTLHGGTKVEWRGDWSHAWQVLKARPTFESEGPMHLLTQELFELVAPVIESRDDLFMGSFEGDTKIRAQLIEEVRRWQEVHRRKSKWYSFRGGRSSVTTHEKRTQSAIKGEIKSGAGGLLIAGNEGTLEMEATSLQIAKSLEIKAGNIRILSALLRDVMIEETYTKHKGFLGLGKQSEVSRFYELLEHVERPTLVVGGELILNGHRAVLESLAAYVGGKIINDTDELLIDAKTFEIKQTQDTHKKSIFSDIKHGWSYHARNGLSSIIEAEGFESLRDGVVRIIGNKICGHDDSPLDIRALYEEIDQSEAFTSYCHAKGKNQALLGVAVIAASIAGGMGGAALLGIEGGLGYALTTAAFGSMSSQLTGSLLTGQPLKGGDFLLNVAKSVAIAAVTFGATEALGLNDTPKEGAQSTTDASAENAATSPVENISASADTSTIAKTLPQHNSAKETLGLSDHLQDFLPHLQRATVNATADMGVRIAFQERPSEVIGGLLSSIAVSSLGSYFAGKIGKAYGDGDISYAAHKFQHALLGATLGAIADGERGAISGALAAPFAEIVMEEMIDVEKDFAAIKKEHPKATVQEVEEIWQETQEGRVKKSRLISRLSSLALGGLLGGSPSVAHMVGDNAIDNNFIPMILLALRVAGAAYTVYEAYNIYTEAEREGKSPEEATQLVIEHLAVGFGINIAVGIAAKPVSKLAKIISEQPLVKRALESLVSRFSDTPFARSVGVLLEKVNNTKGWISEKFVPAAAGPSLHDLEKRIVERGEKGIATTTLSGKEMGAAGPKPVNTAQRNAAPKPRTAVTHTTDGDFVSTKAGDLAVAAKVHKNSLAYRGETHVYVLRDGDGKAYKVGESAMGVRKRDGLSKRAEAQARRLTRETGQKFETEIRRTFATKAEAREYETKLIERFRRFYGSDKLTGNKTNR